MNKKILLGLLLLLSLSIIYSTTATRVYYKEVTIDNSLTLISGKMNDIQKVAQWYLPFAISDTTKNIFANSGKPVLVNGSNSIEIEKSSPFDIWYKVAEKGQSKTFAFTIITDSASSCRVRVNYESTLWSKIFGPDAGTNDALKSLDNLKEYFSDSKKMYGFDMEITEVTDTAFLFLSNVVANAAKREGTKKLFETLMAYAKEKNAGYNGTRIFYYNAADKDSTQLFASIGISNTSAFNNWDNSSIALKRMPYKNKLLVAYYQGAYKNIPTAYSKLEEYKKDHNLTGVALPFAKFLTDGYDFADDQVIQAVVCYPVL